LTARKRRELHGALFEKRFGAEPRPALTNSHFQII
jgi:hypothetical protein